MSFFAVLMALMLEQLKPLPSNNRVHEAVLSWVAFTRRNFDAGQAQHARVVWLVAVLVPSALTAALYVLIHRYSLTLALAFDVLVLYLTLGFRQFSHYYTDIRDALERGDEPQARRLLALWRHMDTADMPRTELLRHVIEFALLAAHRHVFGVFFWFVAFSALGLGPMGAVMYRLAEFCARHWSYRNPNQLTPEAPHNTRLADGARRLFAFMDHAPARLTAAGFAVVGNFEEAVASWRRDASLWPEGNEGVILAAASGAVGVQLGGASAAAMAPEAGRAYTSGSGGATLSASTGATAGAPAVAAHLQSVVGLVWRSVVLWMLLVALLTLANIVG
jgi:adenosylcobinamide-phosphate synthase